MDGAQQLYHNGKHLRPPSDQQQKQAFGRDGKNTFLRFGYHTYEELKKGIDEYILFYNQIRPHKKLKYVSSCEFEEAYYRNLQKK